MPVVLSRRRFITIAAAAVGLPLLLLKAGTSQARPVRWEGTALGAPASIQLYHTDEAQARAAIAAGLNELKRLEAIFSVYRADSAISALNHDGVLENAPADFIALLTHALSLARISDGVYDPTVQPLWQTYFRHFTGANPDPAGPAPRELEAALALVDWRAVEVDTDRRRIAFARPGMGLTLNSGAQGYITDRVTDVLRAHGFDRMLVDMGEPRALSTKPDGSAWRIGIANPADPDRTVATLDVVDQCVSTSGGYGTLFDPAGAFTHLMDTRTGRTAPALLGVSVVANTGTVADGLSTAMLMAPVTRRLAILRAAGGIKALYVTPEGVVSTVEA
ncbi:MAG: thiamine biosynthesis protein ApbE [Betaproteobacteria bacterium CG2_30_59_46]|nr:MAG: thiamine biosynthesis protein ApbE [Betaproteobacteria bacterium CG2_30_59_46]PIQ11898.1 MAG: thiamine biosynthesis protein ApbE [Hydrogenophilales bacterium CG18_big_fil_WC_8_21_14_2_50_58_12]PIY01103.1 MAG: FAD:protein FMN transferase [Hydrogenophilales bacterium CG_4_10_14_3_um_filter_58_23]PJB06124.1 MAG: FAD:protein FMN transferase [Hydrogenophilales bacterium CG_4_9_14_3_um_filter_59_35]